MKYFLFLLVTVRALGLNSQAPRIINYLDQEPPGEVAALFAPGLISTALSEHSAPAFSPDGSIVVWTVMDKNYKGYLLEMSFINGSWTEPARPSFLDTTADHYYASFSIDGKKLFFSSRRKMPPGVAPRKDISIWQVSRSADGWGEPVPLDSMVSEGQEYAHSVSANGTLYFSSTREGQSHMNIRKSENIKGTNAQPVLLPFNINSTGYDDGPYISPDESFLIFESQRPESIGSSLDLYISFREKGGTWQFPVNMGPKINSPAAERFARLSPDGNYLFFGSTRNMSDTNWGFDIFWIDAMVIDELRSKSEHNSNIQEPLGTNVIKALSNNDIQKSSLLLVQWLHVYPADLGARILYSEVLRKQQNFSKALALFNNVEARWKGNKEMTFEIALINFGLNNDQEAVKLLSPLLSDHNQSREDYIFLSDALFAMKKFGRSDLYFEKAMAISSHGVHWYNRACGYVRVGRNDDAFKALDKAVRLGYHNRTDYLNDPDLRSLKSDKRWQKLMKSLE